jgi:uncharacterized protein YjiS (DUF1127 family)
MSTINLRLSTAPYTAPPWRQLGRHFAEWRGCVRSRRELMNLSDSTLRDIGLSRCDASYEASKPFWMA